MPKKGEISPNRKRQEQYEMMGQGLTYERFADRWRKRMQREGEKQVKQRVSVFKTKMTEVAPPPIDPIVPEKKKFLTPFRFDVILLMVIVYLGHAFLVVRLVEYLIPEPTTNTVVVKVKEKVVYKTPTKKVKKPITCSK